MGMAIGGINSVLATGFALATLIVLSIAPICKKM